MLAQMQHRFKAGDFLFFQIEAGFALIRLLGIDEIPNDTIWHIAAFNDLFPDVDSIERATSTPAALSTSIPHVALTSRAFESTQVSEIANSPLTDEELSALERWYDDPERKISDRSIRLLTGLR